MADRFDQATDLRSRTARGTMINGAFQIGLAGLTLARRFVVAAFLTAAEFGIWGALLATLLLVVFVKSVGTADKFVQQDEEDQEQAFQKAFSIDLLLGVVALVLSWIALPVFALLYGRTDIIAPGLVLSVVIVTSSLQAPTWIHYRRMDFFRQRALMAVDPVTAFVVTVALAIGGAGYWSLVIGAVAGSLAGAAASVATSPYRLAVRVERDTLREYWRFSWPLALASGGGILVGQVTLIIAARTMGIAEVGAIGLAVAITAFTGGVDRIVTATLYPAICAVRERTDVLYEAFVKSNRLALMWGVPFGLGLALFASDLVHLAFSPSWAPAIVVLQAFGIAAAIDQVGFNWTAFMRALDWTRPLAVLAALNVVAFGLVTVPLLIAGGLAGFALGSVVVELVNLAGRAFYLRRLFDGFRFLHHAARGIAPTLPAAGAVLLARAVTPAERGVGVVLAELALYCAVAAAATGVLERSLLREALGYLRGRRPAALAPSR